MATRGVSVAPFNAGALVFPLSFVNAELIASSIQLMQTKGRKGREGKEQGGKCGKTVEQIV